MKNKKFKKGLVCFFIFVFILLTMSCNLFAWEPDYNRIESVNDSGETGNAVYTVMGTVINIVSIVGAGIAIIMLIWLAIRYINTYHPAEKAEIKKQLPAYITGAIILFSASSLLKIIQMFADGNINTI